MFCGIFKKLYCTPFSQNFVHYFYLYNWGEPERAPPRALQRLRSLSHNNDNGGISYVLPNAHARGLRGAFKGQSRQSESHRRGIVALLNRLNIRRCVQCDEELRIEHGTL